MKSHSPILTEEMKTFLQEGLEKYGLRCWRSQNSVGRSDRNFRRYLMNPPRSSWN